MVGPSEEKKREISTKPETLETQKYGKVKSVIIRKIHNEKVFLK